MGCGLWVVRPVIERSEIAMMVEGRPLWCLLRVVDLNDKDMVFLLIHFGLLMGFY
jgi:hypothetical protein